MKKCPFCAEEIQDEAIICRYCGRDLIAKAEPKPQPQTIYVQSYPQQKKSSSMALWLVLAIVMVCVIGFALTNKGNGGEEKDTQPSDYNAFFMCQKFVEERLKAPSSAIFAPYSASQKIGLETNRFKIVSYVDAENSFGAKIRTNYSCTVKYVGNDEWQLEDLVTDD